MINISKLICVICQLTLVSLLLVGCLVPTKANYGKAQFDNVFLPGTEKITTTDTATIQSVLPDGRFSHVLIYSVDKRPIFCTINTIGKLLDLELGSATDASTLIQRPTVELLNVFHPTPYKNAPFPLTISRLAFRKLVLPPGEHVLEFGVYDFFGGLKSQGTVEMTSKFEAGKAYVVSINGIGQGLFRYEITELVK